MNAAWDGGVCRSIFGHSDVVSRIVVCLKHIIFEVENSNGAWMHIGMAEYGIPFCVTVTSDLVSRLVVPEHIYITSY